MSSDIVRIPRRNRASDDPKMIGLWKVGRTIGTGAQGRVRIARHSKTGQYAAVKIISKYPTGSQLIYESGRVQHSVEREIVIMKLVDHPNIMKLYDVWETSTDLYLIMEYIEGGELFDYLCSRGRLPTSEALGYFQQIISAVHYCHCFNIAHRDLKPENLLLDQNKSIKLADFGLAAYGANDGMLETFCGSPHYAAPEVISGQIYNGSCSDTWSCGIILHALLTGRLPFNEDDGETLRQKILLAEFTMPEDIDPLAKDLLSKMLEKDVTKRIPITDILLHPFYTSQKCEGPDHVVPKLENIARPVRSLSSIDLNILANLRTLWPGTSDDDIIDSLRNEEKNWQKGIYHLLVAYRSRYLENYDEEEEELRYRSRQRSKKSRRSEVSSPGMQKAQSMATDYGTSPSSLPPRAAPPTPRRANRDNCGPALTGNSEIGNDSLLSSDCCMLTRAPEVTLRSPSPSPSTPASLLSPICSAWNLPPLEVPELEDERMQQFFHQIVDHLNLMQYMTSVSPNPSLLMGSPDPSVASRFRLNNSMVPPRAVGMEVNQNNISGRATAAKSEPLVADDKLGLSPAHPYGLGISNKGEGPKSLAVLRSRGLTLETSVSRGVGKENEDEGYLIVDKVAKRSSLKNSREALGNRRVRIVEPDTERGKLRKKRSTATPFSPTISGTVSPFILPSPSSPKRTWFDGVFKFKPTNYELFSVHDTQTSRSECRRLLIELGVRVILKNVEGLGMLKCKLEDARDSAGVSNIIKAVRFRVEVRYAERGTGYETALRFVQEKGAVSSFKAVFGGVQREWELDVPKTLASPASDVRQLVGGDYPV